PSIFSSITYPSPSTYTIFPYTTLFRSQTTIIANILYGSLKYLEGLKFSLYVFNIGTAILGLIWPANANPIPSCEAILIPPSLDPSINNSGLKFLSGEALISLYG